ncbi:MAG TPA: hypothetical protein VIM62_08905 [Acidobacteriaceae bacterium]
MAMKLGAENKRNVYIVAGLVLVMGYLAYSQLFSGPSAPPPHPAVIVNSTVAQRGTGAANGPTAKQVASTNLDPTLHLERLALSESIEYAGSGRNIFTGEAVAAPVEVAAAPARPVETAPVVTGPPPPPQPPAIDLRYFGYTATHDGQRMAFLLKGEDIFEAKPGEIVSHRYKIVSVDQHSIQVTDLSYNNTQTLPLAAN